MEININLPGESASKRLKEAVLRLNELIEGLYKKELNAELKEALEQTIIDVKNLKGNDKARARFVEQKREALIEKARKSMGYVPAKYYTNMWTALGMAVFGVPMGLAFSAPMDNYAMIGIGLPIGMVLGMAIGADKDKKAKEKGLVIE